MRLPLSKPDPDTVRILREIDRKLSELPSEQQNMAAAFAQGVRAGLALCKRRRGASPGGAAAVSGKPSPEDGTGRR